MDTSVENEERDRDPHLERSSSQETSFSDWQFVERSRLEEEGSDDDSVEIIEYETSAIPVRYPASSDSETEESEIGECFKDFANDEADFDEVNVQSIVPRDKCLCSSSRRTLDQQRITSNGATWKVLYSFLLGILASLVIQQYKSYIPNRMPVLFFGNAFNLTDEYPFSFSNQAEITMPYSITKEDYELARMRNHCEKQKTTLDGALMKQVELMKHARRLGDDVYFFEISKIAPRLVKEDELVARLNLEKPVLPCEDNITSEQLPLVCKNGPAFFAFVKGSQIIDIHDSILRFYGDTEGRAFALHENIITSLTKLPDSEKITDECNTKILVHDWDDYSKSYRLHYRCLTSSKVLSTQSQKVIENSPDGLRSSKVIFTTLTKMMQSDDEERDSSLKCRTCQIFEEVMKNELEQETEENNDELRKELNKFVESCRSCKFSESSDENKPKETVRQEEKEPISGEWLFDLHEARARLRSYYDSIVSSEWVSELGRARDELRDNRPKEPVRQEEKKPISGEWLFDLHKARARLRSYYDSIVSSDWLLKLGRARDELRNNRNKNHRQNGDSQKTEKAWKEYQGTQWYKKKMEKLKSKFKTYMGNVKRHFDAATESVASRFKELKSRLKSKLRK